MSTLLTNSIGEFRGKLMNQCLKYLKRRRGRKSRAEGCAILLGKSHASLLDKKVVVI